MRRVLARLLTVFSKAVHLSAVDGSVEVEAGVDVGAVVVVRGFGSYPEFASVSRDLEQSLSVHNVLGKKLSQAL